MAKSKDEVNKSQAIRDALRANPKKSPMEIAAMLKESGIDVNAQYVSTIKSNARRAKGAVRRAARGIRKIGRSSGLGGGDLKNGLSVIKAAVELVKVAGGIEEAKAALSTVDVISRSMP